MSNFTTIKSAITSEWPNNSAFVPMLLGEPGSAKTALLTEVAAELGLDTSPTSRNFLMFRASLRDPVDLLGVPSVDASNTRWNPPEELYRFSAEVIGDEPGMIVLDELPDATTMMQNALCGLVYDRHIGDLVLGPNVMVGITGNRPKDKSGAGRVITKLANRVSVFSMEVDNKAWEAWALTHGIRPEIVGFLRFRPELLSKFDPEQMSCPTCRTWDFVSRLDASDPESAAYFAKVAGYVGEAAAAEYIGFVKNMTSWPTFESITNTPDTADLPDDPAIRYGLVTALPQKASDANLKNIIRYVFRMEPDFRMLFFLTLKTVQPELIKHQAIIERMSEVAKYLI